MRPNIIQNRPAIAMIELIFALVIMGIVMMSAPQLISTSNQSSYTALQQESIAAAVSQMNMIMTQEWDGYDTNDTVGEPVLRTGSTTFGQCNGSTTNPAGVTSNSGRYCIGLDGTGPYSATPTANFGTSNTGFEIPNFKDDVDDYDGKSYTIKVYAGDTNPTYVGDYIDQNINIVSRVYYGSDSTTYTTTTQFDNPFANNAPGGTTNIKLIHVTLTTSTSATELAGKQIHMSAFMCNVGGHKEIISNESSL